MLATTGHLRDAFPFGYSEVARCTESECGPSFLSVQPTVDKTPTTEPRAADARRNARGASATVSDLTPSPPRWRFRRFACLCMEHQGRWVVALGIAGIVGFVGGLLGVAQGWLGVVGYVGVACLSLLAYSACSVVGALGDRLELNRRLGTFPWASPSPLPRDETLAGRS